MDDELLVVCHAARCERQADEETLRAGVLCSTPYALKDTKQKLQSLVRQKPLNMPIRSTTVAIFKSRPKGIFTIAPDSIKQPDHPASKCNYERLLADTRLSFMLRIAV